MLKRTTELGNRKRLTDTRDNHRNDDKPNCNLSADEIERILRNPKVVIPEEKSKT